MCMDNLDNACVMDFRSPIFDASISSRQTSSLGVFSAVCHTACCPKSIHASKTSRPTTVVLHLQLGVGGMHCASCSTAVEKALRSVPSTPQLAYFLCTAGLHAYTHTGKPLLAEQLTHAGHCRHSMACWAPLAGKTCWVYGLAVTLSCSMHMTCHVCLAVDIFRS